MCPLWKMTATDHVAMIYDINAWPLTLVVVSNWLFQHKYFISTSRVTQFLPHALHNDLFAIFHLGIWQRIHYLKGSTYKKWLYNSPVQICLRNGFTILDYIHIVVLMISIYQVHIQICTKTLDKKFGGYSISTAATGLPKDVFSTSSHYRTVVILYATFGDVNKTSFD